MRPAGPDGYISFVSEGREKSKFCGGTFDGHKSSTGVGMKVLDATGIADQACSIGLQSFSHPFVSSC